MKEGTKIGENGAPIQGGNGAGRVRLLSLESMDRRTAAYRKTAELIDRIEADLGGGDRLSAAEREIVKSETDRRHVPLSAESASGQRPGEPRALASREPATIPLEAGGFVELEHDGHILGQHQRLDLAAKTAQRERDHRLAQLGRRADITSACVVGHADEKNSSRHLTAARRRVRRAR